MSDGVQETEPPRSPAEQIAIALEEIREILPTAVTWGDEGPILDLDTFTRQMLQRGIDYRTLNREIAYAELGMVRAEQTVQRTKKANPVDNAAWDEADRRLDTLRERERVILDQLWPMR